MLKKAVLTCLIVVALVVVVTPPASAMLGGSGICDTAEYYGWDNPIYNRWCMDSMMDDPGFPDGEGPDGTWW